MWSAAGQYEKAIAAFQNGGNWREVLSLSKRLGKSNIKETASELAYDLQFTYQYKDAAFVYEVYCEDFENALESLLTAECYQDAVRLVNLIFSSNFSPTSLINKKQ